jgi:ankyrin repeat protein
MQKHTNKAIKIPSTYECPISGLIMREPVLASDGAVYEKEHIEKWFAGGGRKSPCAGAILTNINLLPQEVLHEQITKFLTENKSLIMENRVYLPKSFLDDFSSAVKEGNTTKIKYLAALDPRLLIFSSEKAIAEGITVIKGEEKSSHLGGFYLACEASNGKETNPDTILQILKIMKSLNFSTEYIIQNSPSIWCPHSLDSALESIADELDKIDWQLLINISKKVNPQLLIIVPQFFIINNIPQPPYFPFGSRLLHFAVKLKKKEIAEKKEIVELVLNSGVVDINSINKNGETAFHLAFQEENLEIIDILLKKGANPNIRMTDGCLPLHLAAFHGKLNLIKLLLPYANIEERDDAGHHGGNTALIWESCGENNIEIIKLLLNHGAKVEAKDKAGWTALHWSTYNGREDAIKVLMKYGADHKARTLSVHSHLLHLKQDNPPPNYVSNDTIMLQPKGNQYVAYWNDNSKLTTKYFPFNEIMNILKKFSNPPTPGKESKDISLVAAIASKCGCTSQNGNTPIETAKEATVSKKIIEYREYLERKAIKNINKVKKLENVVEDQAKQITAQGIKISQLEKDLNELKVSFPRLRISSISEKEIEEEAENHENDETSLENKEETSYATFFRH